MSKNKARLSANNSIEMACTALYGGGKTKARQKTLPLCIHGHTSKLPLLADFPKERVDINPYHLPESLASEFNWDTRTVDINDCVSRLDTCNNYDHIAFFLDSFTVDNIWPINFQALDSEVTLFLGDTQHGSIQGFLKLIELASDSVISKVIAVNNPQHLNLLRASGVPTSKLFFCPLGVSNLPPWLSSGPSETRLPRKNIEFENLLNESPVFVGSLTPFHPRRRDYINTLSREGLCRVIKTVGYADACFVHQSAKISLNISLNSDINFRFGEVISSGGALLSDRLPWIQEQYINQFFGKNIYWFSSLEELRENVVALKKTPKQEVIRAAYADSPFADLHKRRIHLSSFETLNHYLIPFTDERMEIESELRRIYPDSIKCVSFKERLARYIENRDAALQMNSTSDTSTFIIHKDLCPLSMLDAFDLQFNFVKDISHNPAISFLLRRLDKAHPHYRKI